MVLIQAQPSIFILIEFPPFVLSILIQEMYFLVVTHIPYFTWFQFMHYKFQFYLYRLMTSSASFIYLSIHALQVSILPWQTDDKLGKLHLSLIRVVAAFLFGSCIISASSTRFKGVDDKMTFLALRILVSNTLSVKASGTYF